MANITTGSSVVVTTTIRGMGYSENYFHLEIIDPNNTHNWKDGTEVTFTLSEDTVVGTTTISTTVSLTSVGRWKVIVYKGTLGGTYTRVGGTSIQKIVNTTEVVI